MGLQAGVLNQDSWLFRHTNRLHYGVTASALGNVVSGTACDVGEQIGVDIVTYGPVVSDVLSRRGEAADPFTDFPLT